jgi:nucleoside phosphorylase
MESTTRLSTCQLYSVGWISALDKELAAATAMLDVIHQKPIGFKKHPRDENSYEWGSIGDHNIVIASLPSGRYGTISAANTAAGMMSSLPHLRFGLLVGIGAGIPRLDEGIDIRLGDIVISEPKQSFPGVVQYDFGKRLPGGHFVSVGSLKPPPDILLTGISKLRAKHMRTGSEIPQILSAMMERYPVMGQPNADGSGSFCYQEPENDQLYDAMDDTKLIQRPNRTSPSTPMIHYGTIASGNSVIKDGVTREDIIQRLEDKCICFETEAAGLMNNFPCLVIRGISDYGDRFKNDRWQKYASATAAAFAKELLLVMDGEDVERAPEMEIIEESPWVIVKANRTGTNSSSQDRNSES